MSSTDRQSGAAAGRAPGRLVGRRVLFADSLGQGLLQPGIVTGVERDELTLRTPAPATTGAEVQLEFSGGGAADEVFYLQGRVVRVEPLGRGEYAMSLRLLGGKPLPRQSPVWPGPPTPSPELEKPAEPEPAPSPPPRRRKSLWFFVLAILLLWMGIVEGLRRLRIPPLNYPEPGPRIDRPSKPAASAVVGDFTASTVKFAGTSPLRRFSPPTGNLEGAEATSIDGPPSTVRVPEAVAVLAIEDWGLSRLPQTLSGALSDPAPAPDASGEEPAFEAEPDPAESDTDRADEVTVVVDKGRHRLTLYRRGRPIRSFVVGLGRDDSTPAGEFRVVSKATDPDWRHNGRIIPGGSPGNRIGRRWLGLGSGGGATGYGIHPAKNPQTVGKSLSQGCIQMRPEDAEALFRFCPVGTPVIIRP